MKDSKEVQDFVESLYDNADEELNSTYRQKRESRDELLQAIGMILLTYTIVNDVISLSKNDYDKEYILLYKLIKTLTKSDIKQIQGNTVKILESTVKSTFNFYSYNHNLKDVEKIINQNFKGKHFSKRVWDNEHEVAKKLTKQCQDFLQGKINVNQIEKVIKETYNVSVYNSKRLVTTEVSRCHNEAFYKFCEETGVKKVKYNAVLDSRVCEDCSQYDGKIYDYDKKIDLNRHPRGRCFYEISE